jgi:nitrogenase molybdenum-iron protein alpha/beta subunit
VTSYGREVEWNPFLPEGRQGASGMAAALSSRRGTRLKVVVFGDASCRQTFPPLRRLPLFDRWSYFPVGTAPEPGGWVAYDFSERDVIGGAERRLERLLRTLRRRDPGVRVALVQTCVSRLIGDDVRGVLRQVLGDDAFVVLDPDFQAKDSAVDALLWPWVLRAFRRPVRSRPKLVNLVGLGGRGAPWAAELDGLLRACGIGVNARLFPSFQEEELERFDAAPLTVASSCSIVRGAFAGVDRAAGPSRWVTLDPPFGIEGTRRWVERVARELGGGPLRGAARERLARACRDRRRELEPIRAALRGTSIALVAQSRFSAWIFDPAEIFGIRILELLAELGLEAEIFLHRDAPPPPELRRAIEGRGDVTLRVFDEAGALREALAASRSKLLLTSIPRNTPALALGKVPVFVRTFEPGLDGAVRSARRLAASARFRFVERYGRYVRR